MASGIAFATESMQQIAHRQSMTRGAAIVARPKTEKRGPDPGVKNVGSEVDGENGTLVPVPVHMTGETAVPASPYYAEG